MLVKAGWGIAGGVLLVMTVLGEARVPGGRERRGGHRVLYGGEGASARAIGPIPGAGLAGPAADEMRRAIAPSYILVALFYLMLSWSTTLASQRGRRGAPRGGVVLLGVQHGPAADVGARQVPRPRVLAELCAADESSPPRRATCAGMRSTTGALRRSR